MTIPFLNLYLENSKTSKQNNYNRKLKTQQVPSKVNITMKLTLMLKRLVPIMQCHSAPRPNPHSHVNFEGLVSLMITNELAT